MGILKTDIISHSQLPDGNQSVEFDGTGDYLQVPASAAWRLGAANQKHKSVTVEWWIYLNSLSSHTTFGLNALSGLIAYGTSGRYAIYAGGQALINESNSVLDAVGLNEWHHYALVLHGGAANATKTVEFYRDGKLSVSNTYAGNVAVGDSTHVLTIGVDQENNSGYLNGFISNFRWSDEVVYKTEFTVPKFKLKARSSTMLLCCQSSSSVTEAAVSVSGSVTSNGDPAVSAFGPGLKDDITDTGVVFDGVTTFDSQAFMIPPSGKTTERNRGRAIFAGGAASPYKDIQVVDISSGGIAQDFGETTTAAPNSGSASSSTRMLVTSGGTPAPINTIEFITIANIASSTDFGDLTEPRRRTQSLSNSTRAVHVGGTSASPASLYRNEIDFNTIATAGNSTDFGDTLAAHVATGGSVASSTRGVYSVGFLNGSYVNTLEFITIATTGNGQDFGDLNGGTIGYHHRGSTCDSTRGLFSGGYDPSGNVQNKIDFITIASTGNATDFGDLSVARRSAAGTANSTHSIFAGGYLPGVSNTIDRVVIQTTGNAADFGDFFFKTHENSGSSDSHGGLS